MPAKHTIKKFQPGAYYHLYNRGVEKRLIFRSERDYAVLCSYLQTYLVPKDIGALYKALAVPDISAKERDTIRKQIQLNNFSDTIELISYCFMPNHFHFLVWQKTIDAIDHFMNSLWTRYTMYINKQYQRVGPLFQGVYKAVPVETDEQLLHVSRYIHANPRHLPAAKNGLAEYPHSSYREYIRAQFTPWLKPDRIQKFFSTSGFTTYQSFVEDPASYADSQLSIAPLLIDHE